MKKGYVLYTNHLNGTCEQMSQHFEGALKEQELKTSCPLLHSKLLQRSFLSWLEIKWKTLLSANLPEHIIHYFIIIIPLCKAEFNKHHFGNLRPSSKVYVTVCNHMQAKSSFKHCLVWNRVIDFWVKSEMGLEWSHYFGPN